MPYNRLFRLNLRCLQISTSLLGGYFLAASWAVNDIEAALCSAALFITAFAASFGMYRMDQGK